MIENKIVPSLWFHSEGGLISDVISYYKVIFAESFESGGIIPMGESPSGNTEMCQVKIFGQPYSFMSTAKVHHPFNDAFSMTIRCKDQDEIDKYWNYFVREGKEVQCGWCVDKFGLRWQVIPQNMSQLLASPNAWEVMIKQTKIIIDEYA